MPAQLVEVFAVADQQVSDQLSKVEAMGAQRRATIADIQADLAAGLARVGAGTRRLHGQRAPVKVAPSARTVTFSAGHERRHAPSVRFPPGSARRPRGVANEPLGAIPPQRRACLCAACASWNRRRRAPVAGRAPSAPSRHGGGVKTCRTASYALRSFRQAVAATILTLGSDPRGAAVVAHIDAILEQMFG
jgi:hypothetical protein